MITHTASHCVWSSVEVDNLLLCLFGRQLLLSLAGVVQLGAGGSACYGAHVCAVEGRLFSYWVGVYESDDSSATSMGTGSLHDSRNGVVLVLALWRTEVHMEGFSATAWVGGEWELVQHMIPRSDGDNVLTSRCSDHAVSIACCLFRH